ncbi:MAG TPA: lipoprotein [Dyella sp.]|nr:lipoprotein [Dyella sp.]
MRPWRIFALLAVAAGCSGCGNTGPLVLPAKPQAPPAVTTSAPAPASTAASTRQP